MDVVVWMWLCGCGCVDVVVSMWLCRDGCKCDFLRAHEFCS